MSDDLISRSALSKRICDKECKIPEFESERELNAFLLGVNTKQIAVMECLTNAPTAYDVDKVVERPEEQKDSYRKIRKNTYCRRTEIDNCDYCRADHYLDAKLQSVDKDIEIAKAGGVNE